MKTWYELKEDNPKYGLKGTILTKEEVQTEDLEFFVERNINYDEDCDGIVDGEIRIG